MKKNVLSCFDGMSCCQISLNNLGIEIDNYFSSEIDVDSIKVTLSNFPNTKQLGDIRNITTKDLPEIYLLTAGFPCTDVSICGKKKGMSNVESFEHYMELKNSNHDFGKSQSYLFYEVVRLYKELTPKYFLIENVLLKGQLNKFEKTISEYLGVEPLRINSSLVSSQNRERLYWTDIPNIVIPEDKGILTTDIIPNGYGAGFRGRKIFDKYIPHFTVRKDGKFNCLVTNPNATNLVYFKDGSYRKITVNESEQIQTILIGYTNVEGVPDTKKFKMIGNGWTVKVIDSLLEPLKYLD